MSMRQRGGRWFGYDEGSVWGWILIILLLTVAGGAFWLWFGSTWYTNTAHGPTAREDALPPGEEISVWFASPKEDALVSEQRRIPPSASPVDRAKAALQELIAGPKGEALRTIPSEVKVRELFIDSQGTAYVDFTEALSRNHPGGSWSEMLTIRSIIETLAANVPEVKQVQILIEGREAETLAGHIDIRRPYATTWTVGTH